MAITLEKVEIALKVLETNRLSKADESVAVGVILKFLQQD